MVHRPREPSAALRRTRRDAYRRSGLGAGRRQRYGAAVRPAAQQEAHGEILRTARNVRRSAHVSPMPCHLLSAGILAGHRVVVRSSSPVCTHPLASGFARTQQPSRSRFPTDGSTVL
jgi:hypothetical protein